MTLSGFPEPSWLDWTHNPRAIRGRFRTPLTAWKGSPDVGARVFVLAWAYPVGTPERGRLIGAMENYLAELGSEDDSRVAALIRILRALGEEQSAAALREVALEAFQEEDWAEEPVLQAMVLEAHEKEEALGEPQYLAQEALLSVMKLGGVAQLFQALEPYPLEGSLRRCILRAFPEPPLPDKPRPGEARYEHGVWHVAYPDGSYWTPAPAWEVALGVHPDPLYYLLTLARNGMPGVYWEPGKHPFAVLPS